MHWNHAFLALTHQCNNGTRPTDRITWFLICLAVNTPSIKWTSNVLDITFPVLTSQWLSPIMCCTIYRDIIASIAQSIVTSSPASYSRLWHHQHRTVNCDVITSITQLIVTSSPASHSRLWHHHQHRSRLWHHHQHRTVDCDIITSITQSIVTSSPASHSRLWHHHQHRTVDCDIITNIAQSIVTSSPASQS